MKVIFPVREPFVVGVNLTETVQLPPAAKVAPQLFVSLKSPEAAIDEIVIGLPPLFLTVMVWMADVCPTAVFGKVSDAGLKPMLPVAVPVPETLKHCGDAGALSVTQI